MAEWVDVEHDHQGCCLLELVPVHHEQLHHGPPGSGQFARRARPRRRGQNAGCAAHRRYPAAQEHVACLVFGVGQLVLHVENGLIEIFLSVCGSSAPAPSCWDERRGWTSCAASAVLLAKWRERGSCITACLHLNPSMALTTALANSFRLREAAAVVASGGDASDDGGDPPHGRRRAGRDVWRGWLVHPSVAVLPTPSALPAAGVCGRRRDLGPAYRQSWATPRRSPSSIFANDDTRPSFVFAAPVRGRRAV